MAGIILVSSRRCPFVAFLHKLLQNVHYDNINPTKSTFSTAFFPNYIHPFSHEYPGLVEGHRSVIESPEYVAWNYLRSTIKNEVILNGL